MTIKIFVTVLMFILMLPHAALAIGVTPIYREIYFEPNLHRNFSIVMIGDAESDKIIRPYVDGDLANYSIIPNRTFLLPKGSSLGLWVTLKLPEKLTPGRHQLHVGPMEENPPSAGGAQGVIARLGVESIIYVNVPFPSKYLDLRMVCQEAVLGENAQFTVDVANLGSVDLNDVSGYVEIFSPAGANAGRADMKEGSIFLSPAQKAKLSASWNAAGVEPGYYTAAATINYDGNISSTTCNFRLGELKINIADLSVNGTKKGEIAKFVALLQSTWNSDIPQVFSEITVKAKDGAVVGTSKGEAIRIGRWEDRKVTIYWDTGNAPEGDYMATLLLEYQDKNSTKTVNFKIISAFEITWMHMVIICLAALMAYQAVRSRRKRA